MHPDTKGRHFSPPRHVPNTVYTSLSQSVFRGNLQDANSYDTTKWFNSQRN